MTRMPLSVAYDPEEGLETLIDWLEKTLILEVLVKYF